MFFSSNFIIFFYSYCIKKSFVWNEKRIIIENNDLIVKLYSIIDINILVDARVNKSLLMKFIKMGLIFWGGEVYN